MTIQKGQAPLLRIVADLMDALEEQLGDKPSFKAQQRYGEMRVGFTYQLGYALPLAAPYEAPSAEMPPHDRIEHILQQLPDSPLLRMMRVFVTAA